MVTYGAELDGLAGRDGSFLCGKDYSPYAIVLDRTAASAFDSRWRYHLSPVFTGLFFCLAGRGYFGATLMVTVVRVPRLSWYVYVHEPG